MISRERDHSEERALGVKGRLELSRKFIRFGDAIRPYKNPRGARKGRPQVFLMPSLNFPRPSQWPLSLEIMCVYCVYHTIWPSYLLAYMQPYMVPPIFEGFVSILKKIAT